VFTIGTGIIVKIFKMIIKSRARKKCDKSKLNNKSEFGKAYVLGIDTTENETAIGLAGDSVYEIKTWVSFRNQSKELLPNIDKLLSKNKLKPEQLKWVVVNLGPGSFTGLRVGVTVANTFGFGLNIPVIGKSKLDRGAKTRMEKLLSLKTTQKTFKQVLPEYGRPPRITKPKK